MGQFSAKLQQNQSFGAPQLLVTRKTEKQSQALYDHM